MNITEALQIAEKDGVLITNGFLEKSGLVLQYHKDGTFLRHKIIDGSLIHAGSVNSFKTSEIITNTWKIHEKNEIFQIPKRKE